MKKSMYLLFFICTLLMFKTLKAQVSDTIITVENDTLIEEEIEEEPPIFQVVEEMPEFPGGMRALIKYIHKHLKYPTKAKENKIQGKVFVRFVVMPVGKVKKVQIARGVHPLLDAEAVRIVKSLPLWKPGKARGKSKPVWFTVPVNFKIND